MEWVKVEWVKVQVTFFFPLQWSSSSLGDEFTIHCLCVPVAHLGKVQSLMTDKLLETKFKLNFSHLTSLFSFHNMNHHYVKGAGLGIIMISPPLPKGE